MTQEDFHGLQPSHPDWFNSRPWATLVYRFSKSIRWPRALFSSQSTGENLIRLIAFQDLSRRIGRVPHDLGILHSDQFAIGIEKQDSSGYRGRAQGVFNKPLTPRALRMHACNGLREHSLQFSRPS